MTQKQGNLVLEVKEGESIDVDGPATITIIETNYNNNRKRVKVGVNAPKSTNIKRRTKCKNQQ